MTIEQIQELKHSELVDAVAIHSKIPYEQLLEWSENELRFELTERFIILDHEQQGKQT
jgi:hypothetical protein